MEIEDGRYESASTNYLTLIRTHIYTTYILAAHIPVINALLIITYPYIHRPWKCMHERWLPAVSRRFFFVAGIINTYIHNGRWGEDPLYPVRGSR
jgi:hypothetical protein